MSIITLKPRVYTTEHVNAERDRRIALPTTFTITGYGDVTIRGDAKTISNLDSLALKANVLTAQGASGNITNYRDDNNVTHPLSQTQVLDLWAKGAAHIQAVYEASWDIKDAGPIPADYNSDTYWP